MKLSVTKYVNIRHYQTTREFLRSINLEGADIVIFREGRPFHDVEVQFRNGDFVEIEFEQCSDDNGTIENATTHSNDEVSAIQQQIPVALEPHKLVPGGQTCKPNPALGVDFDDVLPFRRRIVNEETVITRNVPPPNWAELPIYAIASSLQAVARDGAGHLYVYYRTWLLHHNRVSPDEPRDGRIQAQLMVNLHSNIRRLWRGYIAHDDVIKTTVVRPNPVLDRNEGPMLLLLVECNRPLGSPTRPILLTFQEIDARGPEPERTWRAYLAPPTINLQYLAERCACEPHHIIAPLGTEDRRWMGQDQSRHVVSGRYIPIWFDFRRPPFGGMEPVDGAGTIAEDDTSLMQRGGGRECSRSPRRAEGTNPPSTQSSSSQFMIHAYRLSREHRVIMLDRASSQSFSEQVTALWAAPAHHGFTDLHIVNFPPTDLESTADSTYIVEFASDRQRQADPADRLILVDIKIQEASAVGSGSHLRRVLWSRGFMSREDMLHLLSSAGICKLTTIQCEVRVNHNLWPVEDSVRRQILPGDFVQLSVIGPEEVQSSHIQIALCEQEAADSQRFIFHASPTPSPEPTTPIAEADGSGADDSDPERPALESREEEERSPSHSLSLLQRGVRLKSLPEPSFKVGREHSGRPENPHVVDLWCGGREVLNLSLLPEDGQKIAAEDHTEVNTGLSSGPKDEKTNGAVLCLADYVPSPQWLRIPCSQLQFVADQIATMNLGTARSIAQVVKWHESTQEAFLHLPEWTDEVPLRYNFFTDGSSIKTDNGRRGASAVVLILDTCYGQRWGGSYTFQVDDNPTSPKTEVVAMVIALIWSVQLGDCHPHHLVKFDMFIGYDCLMAGHTAAGQWRMKAHVNLQTHGRGLVLWIEQRFHTQIKWQHIKSHTGHPWNEAADALSWAAVHGWIEVPTMQDILEILNLDGGTATSWLWMLEAARQGCPGAPTLNGLNLEINIKAPHCEQQDCLHSMEQRQMRESPGQARTKTTVQLRMCTANVLTLYANDKEQGNYVSARQEAIMLQMSEEDMHLIGVQESRSGLEGYRSSDHFHILAAPATSRGVGGVQLWVAKKWAFSHRTMTIASQNLKILHATSRRIVVRIEVRWIKVIVVVCHAPSNSCYEVSESYWNATTNAIPTKYHSWPTFFLCDSNARLGSVMSSSIGAHGADNESESGRAFHHWLRIHGYFVPQTFEQFHEGDHATWRHAGGAMARIDYIVVDEELRDSKIRTWVNSNIDITTKRDDHFCVCASVECTIWDCEPKVESARKVQTDLSQEDPPDIRWSCNVHNHAAKLQDWLSAQQGSQPPSQPRKAHLQPETWELIRWKKYHWKRIRQIRSAMRKGWLRATFGAWRNVKQADVQVGECRPWLKLGDWEEAWHAYHYGQLTLRVQAGVRQNDAKFYQSLVDGQATALADEGMPGLWKQLRATLPKQRAKLKTSIRCTGPDPAEIQTHFCQLEAGAEDEYSNLLSRCKKAQLDRCEEAPLVMALSQIPSRVQMEQLVLKQKSKKAPGLDGVVAETVKRVVRQSSLPLYELYFKAWVLGSEPVQFKGGLIHCISKKQGSKEAHKMRGIMLLETAGKIFHGLARGQLLQWSLPRRLDCQFGGYPYQQTLYATQLIRAITRVFQHRHISSGVLFVDVKAAFHSLLRAHTFGGSSAIPDVLKRQLEADGIDIDALEHGQLPLSTEFCSTAAPSLVQMMQDMHEHTWFTLSQHDKIYRTFRGSRPGSPLADLAYNTMMRAVLARLQDSLRDLPHLHTAKAITGLDCPPVAWVDDVAIPFVASTVSDLDRVALDVLTRTRQVFAEFGLILNQEAGKTEAVLQYRGEGSGPKIEETFISNHGHLVTDDGKSRLRIVTDYSYLGTTDSQSAQIHQEVRTRVGKAQFVFRQLRKQIFRNHRLPVETRITLLNSLVLSIVLHGSGNWPLLSTKQFNALAHTITGWHRSIVGTGFWSEQNVDDTELLASVGVLPLAVRLAKMRLLYAFQWIQHAPQIAIESVTAEDVDNKSWLAAVRQAIRWFRQMQPGEDEISPCTTEDTIDWITRHCGQGPTQVRRAARCFSEQQRMMSQVIQGHRRIHDWCVGKGMLSEALADGTQLPGIHACDLCTRKFNSAQALQGHRWKWHGVISEERRYVYDAVCRICGQCWWTPQRLQQHLKYSRKFPNGCFEQMRRYYAPLEDPVSFAKPETLARVHRLPKCNVQGPSYCPEVPYWQQQQQEKVELLLRSGQLRGFRRHIDLDSQSLSNGTLQAATLEWAAHCAADDVDSLADRWHEALPWDVLTSEEEGLTALFQWGKVQMYDFLQTSFGEDPDRLESVERAFLEIAEVEPLWQWMTQLDELENRRPPVVVPFAIPSKLPAAEKRSLEPYVDLLMQQRALLDPMTRSPHATPRSSLLPIFTDEHGQEHLLVLHMFSGRRRSGDCVEWADHFNQQLATWTKIRITIVSVDTAIDPHRGNLDNGANYNLIASIASKGVFCADLGGPPCETWSGARHLDLGHRGPRPLRSAIMVWGIPHRSMRELRQAATGSRLMLNSLSIDLRVVERGGVSLMEHPDYPPNEEYASVWRSPIHRQIVMAMPGSHELHIQQWRYGSETVKPTLLRVLGMRKSQAIATMRRNELSNVSYPTSTLGGKAETGGFKTAAAKEYPPQMCRLLVDLIYSHAVSEIRSQRTCTVSYSELTPTEYAWLTSVLHAGSFKTKECWLPDYQPSV